MYTIIKDGKPLYVTCTYDVAPNEGGLFCEVYDDEAMDNPIDDFCIHEDELEEHTEEELVRDYILNEFNQ